jgi:hypothetical protein
MKNSSDNAWRYRIGIVVSFMLVLIAGAWLRPFLDQAPDIQQVVVVSLLIGITVALVALVTCRRSISRLREERTALDKRCSNLRNAHKLNQPLFFALWIMLAHQGKPGWSLDNSVGARRAIDELTKLFNLQDPQFLWDLAAEGKLPPGIQNNLPVDLPLKLRRQIREELLAATKSKA